MELPGGEAIPATKRTSAIGSYLDLAMFVN
jgi:hypothetical protein